MPSGAMTRWGERGRGDWITVYANSGHAYMVVAGIRFDTSARKRSSTRWTEKGRSARGLPGAPSRGALDRNSGRPGGFLTREPTSRVPAVSGGDRGNHWPSPRPGANRRQRAA